MSKLVILGLVAAGALASSENVCQNGADGRACDAMLKAEEFEALGLLQTKAEVKVISVATSSKENATKRTIEELEEPAEEPLVGSAHLTRDVPEVDGPVDKFGNPLLDAAGNPINPDALPESGSAAGESGVTLNAEGDIDIAIASLITYGFVTVPMMIGMFMAFKHACPKVYMNNAITGAAPYTEDTMPTGAFGWAKASLSLSLDQIEEAAGLDAAMLIEFCHLCMKILGVIAIPILLMEAPLNLAFGGYAAGKDYLSYLSFGNVENCQDIPAYFKTYNDAFGTKLKVTYKDGEVSTGCASWWLYYMHACVIWVVVFTVQGFIYRSQRNFLQIRYRWLARLPATRAKTVLVENIPTEASTDANLKDQFVQWFSKDKIDSAYIVKDTAKLVGDIGKMTAAEDQKHKLEAGPGGSGVISDADRTVIAKLEADIKLLKEEIAKEQCRIKWFASTPAERQAKKSALSGALKQPECADEACDVNCCNGFVTFKNRSDAEIALNLQYTEDAGVWVVSTPPDSNSLRWEDLQQDPTAQQVRTVVGYLLVACLYVTYLPLVIQITDIANTVNMGPLQVVWAGVAPTLGLQFMVAFLPTFLITIFKSCFTLKADVWAQKMLQNWYFGFQVVFVLLVTAIGGSVVEFTTALLTSPFDVFDILAATMPAATHFYMNFMMMQWSTHATNMVRMVNLFKFNAAKKLYSEEEAVALCEPEDQDYYGMGSRSARFTINMAVAIIYGTLSPPIIVLTFVNFALCRLFYGWLLVFSETKKADTGGTFWVSQLTHLFDANIIYCVVMIGVLMGRASNSGPAFCIMPTLVYVIWSKRRFATAFSWEKLPYAQLSSVEAGPVKVKKSDDIKQSYMQPELAY